MPTSWFALEDLLDPAVLIVQAQAVPPNDDGDLLWDMFFPREDVESVDINSITTLDDRPTASRREWNANGRQIPLVTPTRRLVSMVPIEAFSTIDEYEMARLVGRAGGNSEQIREIIGASIPARVERLALADYRRLEVDCFQAWTAGSITQRNPENAAQTYVASFGFSGTRYTTAGTAWDNAAVNAYDQLILWITAAQNLVGQIEGVMMRQATLAAILADAPNLPNSVKMSAAGLDERVSADIKQPFTIYVNEKTVDIYDDGGITKTRTYIWPAQKIAAIPVGKKVGVAAFAPVTRAAEADADAPGAGIDVRGVTVYHLSENSGKELRLQAQLNAIPIPSEQLMYVTNVGV